MIIERFKRRIADALTDRQSLKALGEQVANELGRKRFGVMREARRALACAHPQPPADSYEAGYMMALRDVLFSYENAHNVPDGNE